MKRKLLLIILLVLCCVGCYKSKPEDVKLKNEKQAKKFVADEYGKAKYIGKEKGENKITYTFEDDEYKFKYTFVSAATVATFDASDLGYEETHYTTFYSAYKTYILTKLDKDIMDLHSKYGGSYEKDTDDFGKRLLIINMDWSKKDALVKDVNKLLDKVKEIDDRKLLNGYYVRINDKNDRYQFEEVKIEY